MMASIRNDLNLLDAKISEFQQIAAADGKEQEPIDLENLDIPIDVPAPEVVEEPEMLPDDDLPFFETETVLPQPEPIIDSMVDRQAWRTDMPGGAVKDIRSAISLNDRILFINKLFAEDPIAFQTAVGKLNTMESLEQVVEYVVAEHPDWNLESDIVYRFMMAVRRKVR